MALFKKLFLAVSLLISIILGLGLFLPSYTEVSRSISINRDIADVYTMVNDYREFNKWSPWARRDENTQYEFSGPATGVGSKMSWRSEHPNVGNGSQEIIASIKNQKVSVKLDFEGQGSALAHYLLEPEQTAGSAAGTRISWGFRSEHGFNVISRYFGLMLDDWVGADYEAGLQNLKELLEKK